MSFAMLELQPIDTRGRHVSGPLLVNVADIESVQTARDGSWEVGSIVRTRSGDMHRVAESVKTIKANLAKAREGSE